MTLALTMAGLLLVAVLTAAAAAVRSVSRIWLRHWVEERLGGGGSATPVVYDVQRLLLSAGTAVALVAFATGAVIGTRFQDSPQALLERVAIATVLILVAGQLVPRAIGRRWATALVPVLVPVLRVLTSLLTPLVVVAQRLAASTEKRATVQGNGTSEREALEDLLREGELEGVGDPGESAIISGVVEFADKLARDVMTPRTDIFHLDRHLPPREIVARVAQTKYSRVPITDGGVDRIEGMIHAFDLLKWDDGPLPPLRRVVFARDSESAAELLSRLLRDRVHLAIVRDERGLTQGLITLEDLLEELVGDIRDEHDEPGA